MRGPGRSSQGGPPKSSRLSDVLRVEPAELCDVCPHRRRLAAGQAVETVADALERQQVHLQGGEGSRLEQRRRADSRSAAARLDGGARANRLDEVNLRDLPLARPLGGHLDYVAHLHEATRSAVGPSGQEPRAASRACGTTKPRASTSVERSRGGVVGGESQQEMHGASDRALLDASLGWNATGVSAIAARIIAARSSNPAASASNAMN